jgi:thiol-disulfide isomerase/thioredoxin
VKTLCRLASLALLSISPTLVLAQDAGKAPAQPVKPAEAKPAEAKSEGKVDPEAEKLMKESSAAIKKIRDITYKVKQTGGMDGGDAVSRGVVTLTIPEQIMGFPFERYKVELHDETGKATSVWSSNGKTIQKIDHAKKKLLSMDLKNTGMNIPPQELWGILPQWLMEDLFANPMVKTTEASLGKDVEAGGVKCRVVTRTQEMKFPSEDEGGPAPKMVTTSTKHLGADDLIPRKIETVMKVVGGGEEMGNEEMKSSAEISEVKINAGLKPEDFTLKAPEGYASEAGTYESMGMQDPEAEQPELKAEVGKPALPFALKDATGKEVTLESLKGRVVLLDFWATWCGPCVQAMPEIQKLHEKYADKAVTIIGVNTWEKQDDKAIKFMEKKKYTYTLLLKGDDLAKEYGISGIPTLILIDKAGNVLHTGVGFGPGEGEHLAELIDKELAKK